VGGKRSGRGAPGKRSVLADLSNKGAGVAPRRHPSELGMRPFVIVIVPPGFQHSTGVRPRPEQRLVQQLIAQPAVEVFDEAVLLRFAGCDVVPPDASLVRPAEDGI